MEKSIEGLKYGVWEALERHWSTGDESADSGAGTSLLVLALQFTNHVILTSVPQFPPLGKRVILVPNSKGCDLDKWVSMHKDFITVPGIS